MQKNGSSTFQIEQKFCRQSSELLEQAVVKTRHCLSQIKDDQIWWRAEPSLNSIGNLILHVTGNLRQWGIVPLTGADDLRDRPAEFAETARLSRARLLEQLNQTTGEAQDLWSHQPAERLKESRVIQGFDVSLMLAIIHASTHFVGHAHQIILLTRLQLGSQYRFQWIPGNGGGRLPI